MKKSISFLFLFFTFSPLFAQEIVGSWAGELDIQGTKLPLIFNIKNDNNNLKSTADSPMQGAKNIPIDSTTFSNNELLLDAKKLGFQYKGKLENQTITGTFSQGGMSVNLVLTRKKEGQFELKRPQEPKPPFNYIIQEVTFTNQKDNNTLAGTLTLPKDKNQFPIAILITGSGPENRDSEIFGHKPFWVIADDFAKKGIGVLRIDDRGIGGSSKGNNNDTSQSFAGDINTAVDFLAKKGYKNIGLIGHSEGGLIAPMVAINNKNVKFIISMAGPGIPINELLLLQTIAIAKAEGATDQEVESTSAFNKKLYEFVKNYNGNDLKKDIKPMMTEEFKTSFENQMADDKELNQYVDSQIQQITNPWFVYFIKTNPQDYWSKIKIPVLAINGTKDLQVIATENLDGIKKSLEKAGNKKFEIKPFENLNHLFQTANSGAVSEYVTIEETISPAVLNTMSNWILKQ